MYFYLFYFNNGEQINSLHRARLKEEFFAVRKCIVHASSSSSPFQFNGMLKSVANCLHMNFMYIIQLQIETYFQKRIHRESDTRLNCVVWLRDVNFQWKYANERTSNRIRARREWARVWERWNESITPCVIPFSISINCIYIGSSLNYTEEKTQLAILCMRWVCVYASITSIEWTMLFVCLLDKIYITYGSFPFFIHPLNSSPCLIRIRNLRVRLSLFLLSICKHSTHTLSLSFRLCCYLPFVDIIFEFA